MTASTAKLLSIAILTPMLLIGCGSTPKQSEPSAENLLYDGDARTLYSAGEVATTTEEAMERGRQALQLGEVDRALFEFVKAFELDPDNYEALYMVGATHARRGNLARAALAFQMALKINDQHAGILEGLGLIMLQKRHYQEAKGYIQKSLVQDPNRWKAHNGLGVVADLNKEYDIAQLHYATALSLSPNSAVVLNNLGYSRYLAGDWDGADQNLTRALNRDPNYKQAWLNLGLLHTRRGHYSRAFNAFRKTTDKPMAYERIGYLCMIEGKYKAAEYYFRRAIDASPTYFEEAFEGLERLADLRRGDVGAGLDARNDSSGVSVVYPLTKPAELSGVVERIYVPSDAQNDVGAPLDTGIDASQPPINPTDDRTEPQAATKIAPVKLMSSHNKTESPIENTAESATVDTAISKNTSGLPETTTDDTDQVVDVELSSTEAAGDNAAAVIETEKTVTIDSNADDSASTETTSDRTDRIGDNELSSTRDVTDPQVGTEEVAAISTAPGSAAATAELDAVEVSIGDEAPVVDPEKMHAAALGTKGAAPNDAELEDDTSAISGADIEPVAEGEAVTDGEAVAEDIVSDLQSGMAASADETRGLASEEEDVEQGSNIDAVIDAETAGALIQPRKSTPEPSARVDAIDLDDYPVQPDRERAVVDSIDGNAAAKATQEDTVRDDDDTGYYGAITDIIRMPTIEASAERIPVSDESEL